MNGPIEGYITLQQAADLLGVSRQTVTRRALAAELSTDSSLDGPRTALDSNLDSLDSSLDNRPASIVRGKKRYISRAWVLAEQATAGAGNRPTDSPGRSTDSNLDSLDSSLDSKTDSPAPSLQAMQQRIQALDKDLLAAQGEANTLKATVTAQEAHIDSLKRALDAEQSLHMALLQQRLPAGHGETPAPQATETAQEVHTGRGSSFIGWIKGWGKKQQ